jgi:hypothetical protein
MEEVPHRTIIDFKAMLGELGDEPADGEAFLSNPLQKPDAVLTSDRLRLVAAHLARCNTAGIPQQPNPGDHRANADAKLRSRLAS